MNMLRGLIFTFAAIVTPFLTVSSQEPVQPLPHTRIVLRVSGEFLQGLIGTRFQRNETIAEDVEAMRVTGTANVAGKICVRLRESDSESSFDVSVKGEVLSQLIATPHPIAVHVHGIAPFKARQAIMSKDGAFLSQVAAMDVCNQFALETICTKHGGLPGALTRRIALPFVRKGMTDGDRVAEERIRAKMTPILEIEMGKLVESLNKLPPLVKSAHELIILESRTPPSGIRFYHAATKEHLLISVDGPNRRIPELPNLDKTKRAPVELWIEMSKNASREERRKFMVQNWRLITPFLSAQLQRRSSNQTKEADEPLVGLLEEVQIHEVPGWHLVTFGAKLPLAPVQEDD